MEAASQYCFDPMNLASHVYRRHLHDFSDHRCIEILQIQQHDFPVRWTQSMDQFEEPIEIHAIVRIARVVAPLRHGLDFFQAEQET